VFLTVSPSQQSNSSWVFGTDLINYVRFLQVDSGTEGAWLPGEYLLFGNVYADVAGKAVFSIGFDDGSDSQYNPSGTSIVSASASVSSTLSNMLTTATAHNLKIGTPIVFTSDVPTSLIIGTKYWVKTIPTTTTFTLATDDTLITEVTTSGFSGASSYQYAGTQLRSGKAIVESYGFKGTLFIVPSWLGSEGVHGYDGNVMKYMTAANVQKMYADGWSVGSHTNTHPSNGENAGLRLLGPYGFYLSNTIDNLSAKYISAWGLGASNRRRVVGGAVTTNVLTTENSHKFILNMPIEFTDIAPTGCTINTVYYIASIPSSTTFTLSIDQGTFTTVALQNWAGTANYKFAGATNDDTAIYTDIEDGIKGVAALGIPTAAKFFALPQGGADEFVRSACIRSGLVWIRGTGNIAHTIPVGLPTGDGLSAINNPSGGWLMQHDAVQTDGGRTQTEIRGYINSCIVQGACGCSYHHGVYSSVIPNLDQMCAHLKVKSDANLISVMTMDEIAAAYGF
jgi:hypothetical protein